ncbi:DUF1642 domain-containing protein [Bacillus sp. Y1]|nr:DUF1642 domain-containing protein [Bacillus sp. Y1]
MDKKIVIPKEIADAVESLKSRNYDDKSLIIFLTQQVFSGDHDLEVLVKYTHDTTWKVNDNFMLLISALINGYNVEQTPEDKLREFYLDRRKSSEGSLYWTQADAVEITLDLLGIKIEGINS